MGSSKSTQTQSQNDSSMSSYTTAPRSGSEQQILNQLQGYGDQQLSFLNNLVRGGTSPFALNSADQAQLDQAYGGAMNRFQTEGKDYADYLATTRGLNKSDTPVSQQAMERYGMGMADLLSQKANQGLNMGLQGTGLRLQGTQALPSGLLGAFNPQFQERMQTGIQRGSGSSSGVTTMRNTPSLMQQISGGMSLASQGIGLGAQIGGMAMGLPMPSMGGGGNMGLGGLSQFTTPKPMGMGSGASANSWFM
jgi:hypothetical protein